MNGANAFEAGGYVGIALIQCANLPSLIGVMLGWSNDLPPLSMVLMVWAGLLLFLARSIYNRQTLYIVSEGIGIILQTLMLMVVVYR
jgi:uncharacterized protein YqgC (DUF456 family)